MRGSLNLVDTWKWDLHLAFPVVLPGRLLRWLDGGYRRPTIVSRAARVGTRAPDRPMATSEGDKNRVLHIYNVETFSAAVVEAKAQEEEAQE